LINRELIEYFSEIAREKNVDRSELGSILEQLFMYIVEKERGDNSNCSVIVNIDKGEIEIYVEKEIVDDVEDPVLEILLEEANNAMPGENFEVGDVFVEIIDPTIFGRRMINTAKQFFNQRLQDVEKHYIYEDYSQRVGEIVIGVVHQVQRDNVFINIEQAELRLPKKEQIYSERYRRGDTIRAVVKSVEVNPGGPEIIVSRSDNHFLYKLFEMEVPEIDDGIIEILAIARHPGERAKIIVKSQDRRIDPVGACVGMRGSRIQAIVRELNNEKIDIINQSEQPEILISRALSPAKPIDLYIDDIYWLYDNNIGVKIPLSTVYFNEGLYLDTKSLLNEFHRKGNAILVSTEAFAKRLREDFPLYEIELSAVKDIYTKKKLDAVDRSLFDTIVFPMCANNDLEFLKSVDNKDQIRLFSNVECSYSCPNKVCYTSMSKVNKDGQYEDMKCSWHTYDMPRTFSRSDVDMELFSNKSPSASWGKLIFNNNLYKNLGYTNFKLLSYSASQQRIDILNELKHGK